jgi:hypothetical protein
MSCSQKCNLELDSGAAGSSLGSRTKRKHPKEIKDENKQTEVAN